MLAGTGGRIQPVLLLKSQYDLSREVLEAEKRSSTVEMKLAKITNEVEKTYALTQSIDIFSVRLKTLFFESID